MSANLLQPEKIEIVDFKIIKGQINSPFDFEEEKVQGHNFNVNFELGFNIPDKLIKADFSVNVETKSEKEDGEELVAQDDAVIGRALKISLVVILLSVAVACGVIFWISRPDAPPARPCSRATARASSRPICPTTLPSWCGVSSRISHRASAS